MPCCCSDAPNPENCFTCSLVKGCNIGCATTTSEFRCANNWIVQQDIPCDWFQGFPGGTDIPPQGVQLCSTHVSNYPAAEAYENCSCLEMTATCFRRAFAGSCMEDGTPNPCFKTAFRTITTKDLFVFDGASCRWVKIASRAGDDTGVIVDYALGTDCSGTPDPTVEACTPPVCDGPYEGCECFP